MSSAATSSLSAVRMTYELCIEGIHSARSGDPARSLRLFQEALITTPASSASLLCIGLRLLAEGKAHDALQHFNRGLDVAPTTYCQTRLLRSRALLHHSTRSYCDALVDFDAALALDPDYADAFYLRGLVYFDLKRFEACVDDMTNAIRLSGVTVGAAAYMNRGNAQTELGRYAAAIRDLSMAIELDAGTSVMFYNRANVYCLTRDLHLALADYTRSIELDRYHASAYFNRGNTYHELGQYELAIADFTSAIRLDPADAARFLESRGCSYCRLGRLQPAYDDFTQALGLLPNASTLYLNRSTVLLRLERYPEALADLNRCLDLNRDCAMAYTKRADIHLQFKQYDMASDDFTAALALSPDDAYTRYMRGTCHLKRQDYEVAIADFTAVIAAEPGFVRAYLDRAAAYASDSLQQYRLAIDDFTRVLDLDPKERRAFVGRARAAQALGQHYRVILDCDQAQCLTPDDVEAIAMRARSYAAFGAFDQALESMDTAVARTPSSAVLLSCRADLYMAIGRPDLALGDYISVISKAPDSTRALCGVMQARRALQDDGVSTDVAQQVDIIEWHLRKARRLSNSFRNRARLGRALLSLRLQQYDRVLREIDMALQMETDDVREHLLQGRCMIQFRRGRETAAVTSCPIGVLDSYTGVRLTRSGTLGLGAMPLIQSGSKLGGNRRTTQLRRSISSLLSRSRNSPAA